MATGGQIMSSEEAFDYNCTPCFQQERFLEAKRFCVECGEYFCSKCLSHHVKFSVTKGHTLIKCEEVTKDHVPACLSKCDLHTDKEEDMVCCDHNVVCCRSCITKDHSTCQNIDYLPRLAQNYKKNEAHVELVNNVKKKMQALKEVQKEYTIRALKLKTRKTTSLKQLEAFKSCLDMLVAKAETDVEHQFEPDIRSMQQHIGRNNELLSKFISLSEDLSIENDDISVYKKVLECKHTLQESQVKLYPYEDKNAIGEKVQNEIVKAIDILKGEILFCYKDDVAYGKGFDIPAICVKEEETPSFVLVADFTNKKIRRVEEELNKSECFDIEEGIWGICEVSKQENVFTLPGLMKVQFISTDKSPVLGSSFFTNLPCRGIAYYNEMIFVTGGGMTWEKTGALNVFDLEGKHLCKHVEDFKGKYFSIPRSIIVNSEGIYITDQQNGIICLDLEGKRKWVCTNTKCKFPWGICFTPNGNLLVTGHESNNIVIVSKDGEFLGELLNMNDGLSKPRAIGINKRNNYIIVSELNKPHLKMFYISDFEI